MKKKGFTLIELLAVIVILAIIALIAIPLIGNVIEKSKIGALENSVNGLVESANMYYANQSIKGEQPTETIFDFANGEQTSSEKLEYRGKVYNGKLILHTNGEVAVCINDDKHYAYKNKDSDEIISGIGTCLYDGTTGDFSGDTIKDLRGQTLTSSIITEEGENAIITIPEEGHYDGTSKISVPIETIKNNVPSLNMSAAKTEGAKEALSKMKSVSLPYTVPSDGVICVNLSMTVTNHDNSAGGSMWCSLLKNGSTVKSSSTSISGWSGGSCSIQVVLQVSAGDVISYSSGYQLEYDFYLGTSITSTAVYAPLE